MRKIQVDALVVGGGIAGMQTALDLADQGYQVALVEKEASIGGKMIALSKVFPTLDCCSCITTPKMSAVAHHSNIQLLTYHEVQNLNKTEAGFTAEVLKKPRYVNEEDCTGCRQCEYACPINLPSAFDLNYGATKAVCVPFSTAVPQYAVLDIENCILCGKCEKACPVNCIDFTQQPETIEIQAEAVGEDGDESEAGGSCDDEALEQFRPLDAGVVEGYTERKGSPAEPGMHFSLDASWQHEHSSLYE